MADETASGLPYPELPDANNPPADIRALAEAIDAIYGNISVANVAALPATANFVNQRIYIEDIDAMAWWDQKTAAWQGFWRDYTPTIVGTVAPTLAFQYLIDGENVRVRPKMTLTATISTVLTATLPVAADASYAANASVFAGAVMYRDTSVGSNARTVGFPLLAAADTIAFSYNLHDGTSGTNSAVTTGTNRPFAAAWASGDTIDGEFSYRRA